MKGRMRGIIALLASGALALGPSFSDAPADPRPLPDSTLVLRDGRYLDVRDGVLRPNGAIVVRSGRIVEIQPAASVRRPPPGARTLDLRGRTILPV